MRRWTIKELDETDDLLFAISILNERHSSLKNLYSPLSQKLTRAVNTLAELRRNILRESSKTPASSRDNRLAGGYILLSTYATLTDDEAKALRDTDEMPTAVIAIKEAYLREWIKPEYSSLEEFLDDYTFDTIASLSAEAELHGVLAFEYREGLDDPFVFGSSFGKDAVLAYTDFLSGKLQENGHEAASKYLDCLLSI